MNIDRGVASTINLSEEQLVQCCNTNDGKGQCPTTNGCSGGFSDQVGNAMEGTLIS